MEERLFSIILTEEELKLFSEFQKEFGARERKMRRKQERALQNVEMHSNRAVNKAEKAAKALKAGNVEQAGVLQNSASKAIESVSHDMKRATDLVKYVPNQEKVTQAVNNTAKKAEQAEKVVTDLVKYVPNQEKVTQAATDATEKALLAPKANSAEKVINAGKKANIGEFVAKNKKALIVGGTLAAAGTALGTGIAIARKKNKNNE